MKQNEIFDCIFGEIEFQGSKVEIGIKKHLLIRNHGTLFYFKYAYI